MFNLGVSSAAGCGAYDDVGAFAFDFFENFIEDGFVAGGFACFFVPCMYVYYGGAEFVGFIGVLCNLLGGYGYMWVLGFCGNHACGG